MEAVVKQYHNLFLIVVLIIGLFACGSDENPESLQQSTAHPIDVEEMVLIPAGEITIGTNNKTDLTSGNEVDAHLVFVETFYIDKYEVTNEQYAKFLMETGHRKPKFWNHPELNAPDQPVVGVNWEDAEIYAHWAGKRLPTDIEWEKAARSIAGRLYPWGNKYDASLGNFDDAGQMNGTLDGYAMKPAPVGSFPKGVSPYGLHDMAGNVWEWVTSNLIDTPTEKAALNIDTEKVYTIRGGSWTNGPGDTRTTVFYIYPAQCSDHSSSVGFRCAKTP